jgi:hypothetical protein
MNRGRALAVGLVAAVLWACAGAGAAAAAQKNAAKGPTLAGAVAELKREYAAYRKDPDAAPLRTASDYFLDQPGAPPPAAVLAALEKPLGDDARLAAYVKWQLLSALPETLEEADDAQRLIKAYQKAPLPALRYGAAPREKQQLDALLTRARPQDDVPLTARLEEAVAHGHDADAPVMAYRDALYRRLPVGRDRFRAGLQDAYARLSVAAPTTDHMARVAEELRDWARSGDATAAQVGEVAELVGRLRFEEGPPYYASAAVRRGKLSWVVKRDTLMTGKKLADLHKLLLDAAASAAQTPSSPPDADGAPDAADPDPADGAGVDAAGDDDQGKPKKTTGKNKKAGTDS